MAGYMYLGSQRVCPAVVSGGSPEPETNERLLIKMPDGVITSSNQPSPISPTCSSGIKVDFGGWTGTNKAYFYNCFKYSGSTQGNFILETGELKEILGGDVQGCFKNLNFAEGHTDIYFDNLERITYSGTSAAFVGNMFENTNITSLHFPKLYDCQFTFFQTINCGHLYFDAVNSHTFDFATLIMFSDLSDQTVHFPSNMASVVPTLDGYPNFGGTNTTILYDLEPTEN